MKQRELICHTCKFYKNGSCESKNSVCEYVGTYPKGVERMLTSFLASFEGYLVPEESYEEFRRGLMK
jgi:hypothetical protein